MSIRVAPSLLGDPVSCFLVDHRGYLVTGTCLGNVTCWKLTSILYQKTKRGIAWNMGKEGKRMDNMQENIEEGKGTEMEEKQEATFDGDVKAETISQMSSIFHSGLYQCLVLASSSDECIRDLFCTSQGPNANSLFALVGDQHAKIWDSLRPESVQIVRFRRQHLYETCPNTITLCENGKVFIVSAGSNDIYSLNLETMQHNFEKLPVVIGASATVGDLYQNKLVWTEVVGDGQETKILNLSANKSDAVINWRFPRTNKHYWGFQLHGEYIAYISNWSRLKIYRVQTRDLVYRIEAHEGNILTFCWDRDSLDDLYTLGVDRTIAWWSKGQLCKRWKVEGSLGLWYPHILKKYGDILFYSADDGVYALILK